MYWVIFVISGFIVASVPWVAGHFGSRVAGYLVLIPVMMLLSFSVQYISHGPKATTDMIQGTLWGLPSLLIFGLVALFALRNHSSLPLAMVLSLVGWFVSLLVINNVLARI